ncbi:MAG: hypothetical protein LWW92_03425 [Rhodocyclales bacterium]|nr:hypothetical protein [Rhodocyclales bacterium]
MDVFYYWKDYSEDLEVGRVGHVRSTRAKLAELAEGAPDYIWVFKTPKGQKGRLQLIGRLWCPANAIRLDPTGEGESRILYDPRHEASIRFANSDTPEAVDAITAWVSRHFAASVRGNFQGERGQLALRAQPLTELRKFAATLEAQPFLASSEAEEETASS